MTTFPALAETPMMRVLRSAASAQTGMRPKQTPVQHPHGPGPATASFLNPSNVLSLPVVTDNKQVLWVLSDQACRQVAELDKVAELVEALNAFPYPTRGEMAALAQRCSLPLEQVRVWFMIQRLRYGISWDWEDVCEVRQSLLPGSAASCSGQAARGDAVVEGAQGKRGGKASEGQGEVSSVDGEPEGEHDVKGGGGSVAERRHKGGDGEGNMMGQEQRKKPGRKPRTAAWQDGIDLLRDTFVTSPFPSSEVYDHLISQMTPSRSCVTNWFGHLRYRIKNGYNPQWLPKRECHLIRRRIKYRQKMMALKSEKGNQN